MIAGSLAQGTCEDVRRCAAILLTDEIMSGNLGRVYPIWLEKRIKDPQDFEKFICVPD
jgi:hypothetical protein